MRIWREGVRAALGAALVLAVVVGTASAHSILQRSIPSANASLSTPPRQVVLVFSEPVVAGLSTATVVDRQGAVVSQAVAVAGDGRALAISVGPLATGVYTVRWRVLSATDGHTTSGFLLFGVGERLPAGGAAGTGLIGPPVSQVLVRWVNFAAAMLLAGTVFFEFLILRPLRPRPDTSGVLRAATVTSAAVLLVGLTGEFVLEAAILLDTPVTGVWRSGTLWTLLGGTKTGWSTLARAAGAIILLIPPSSSGRILRAAMLIWCVIVGGTAGLLGGPVALVGSVHLAALVLVASVYGLVSVMAAVIVPKIPDAAVPEFPIVGPIAAAAMLAGITVSSHAVGSGSTAAVLDWLHLLGTSLWIGGLAPLWLVLRHAPAADRASVARILVPRFSRLAAMAVGILLVTGVYSALVHVGSLPALTVTPYGRTLLVKLLFVILAVALGAYHRFVMRPRLEGPQPADHAPRAFLRSLAAEAVLGAVILLAVALLTITPPAAVTMPVAARAPLVLAGLASAFRVDLTISPAEPGWNRFEAMVRTGEEPVPPEGTRILLRLTKLDEDLDPVTVTLQPDGGRFTAEGGELGVPGWWEVQVIVRQRGTRDATTLFSLKLGSVSGRPDAQARRILMQARETASRVRTWREREQITDGSAGVTVTDLEMMKPDRVHYRTAGGAEAVIIGVTRLYRQGGGPWERDMLPSAIVLLGPYVSYLNNATAISLGRMGRCDEERCRIVTWTLSSGNASFAAWIGLDTFRIYRLYMAAPFHYMTTQAFDLNAPLRINPP